MAWLIDWDNRVSFTLSRASGEVEDYQIKLLIGESSSVSGVDVNLGGKGLSSFNDLRFTSSDGETVLPHWVESVSGTTPNQTATVWVKCDVIGTSATTFYVYYGNALASSVASAVDTLIHYEDFEWGDDEDALTDSGGSVTWTIVQGSAYIDTAKAETGTRAVSCRYNGSVPIISMPCDASDNIAIHFSVYLNNVYAALLWRHGNGTKRPYLQTYGDDYQRLIYYGGSSHVESETNVSAAAWHKFEIKNFNWSAGTYSIYMDGTLVADVASMPTSTQSANIIELGNIDSSENTWYDNIYVRNYRSTEPALGSFGSEETLLIITPDPFTLSATLTAGAGLATIYVAVAGSILKATASMTAGPIASFALTDYIVTYLCTLSGGGVTLTIPMSSFQSRLRSGTPSYLSVAVPGLNDAAGIAALMADPETPPTLSVYRVQTYVHGDSTPVLIASVTLNDAQIHEGPTNSSIVLSGERQRTNPAPKSLSVTGAQYRSVSSGKTRYRVAPNTSVSAGDTVTVNGETFAVALISLFVSPDEQTMEISS